VEIEHWGTIEFREAWRRQELLANAILLSNAPDTLVFCQHPPVITYGRSTPPENLVGSAPIDNVAIEFIEVNRGGEATAHNPGQLVGYPIINLQRHKPDLHWFLREIEACIIESLGKVNVHSATVPNRTGVWIEGRRKICAIGFHCKQWITTHGFALNVNNNLGIFNTIVPCGITDSKVTSILEETGKVYDMQHLADVISMSFSQRFTI
jgi:lipoyl(octanoyl) transferase